MSASALTDHVADHFQLHGLGAVGTSIFQDEIPAGAQGLLLMDTGGPGKSRVFGSVPLTMQVTARKLHPAAAKALAWQAYGLVGDLRKTRLGGPSGTLILDAIAIQQPFSLGRDEDGKMFRFVFNLRLTLGRNA
jgi:hypothetical protein